MKCQYLKAEYYYIPALTVPCEHYSIGTFIKNISNMIIYKQS